MALCMVALSKQAVPIVIRNGLFVWTQLDDTLPIVSEIPLCMEASYRHFTNIE